jgi:hypothetical protein
VTRPEATTALAKVFAYLACGKRSDAARWARVLIEWLETL